MEKHQIRKVIARNEKIASEFMPTDRYDKKYNMTHSNRGLALIFNHEYFELNNLKPRLGTNIDRDTLKKCLNDLKFNVKICNNYSYLSIKNEVEMAASQDHKDNDCIVIAILSHGGDGIIYAKDMEYKLDYICSYFTAEKCPSLAGKPKLFFIQACRGNKVNRGFPIKNLRILLESKSPAIAYKIPNHSDFLIAYSTIEGYVAYRSTMGGSCFIQALCAELKKNGKRCDILTLLTNVCQHVASDFETRYTIPELMHSKQQPCITSMLTRLLRFN